MATDIKEIAENKETTVLSNTQTGEIPTKPESEEAPPLPAPENERPLAERQRNFHFDRSRVEGRDFRKKLAELHNSTADEEKQAVIRLAEEMGFDTKDPATLKQAELVVRANRESTRIRATHENSIKVEAATMNLKDTLVELGYEAGTTGHNLMGNMLFKLVGTEDPDRFADRDFVESKIQEITSATARKPKKDVVASAVVAKGGAPKPAAESRTANKAKPSADDPVQGIRAMHPDMSEETARMIAEQQNKLPSYGFKRKTR